MLSMVRSFALVFISTTAIFTMLGVLANYDFSCADPIGPETALALGVAEIYERHEDATYWTTSSMTSGSRLDTVHYDGLSDFQARNPDCCTFTPYGEDEYAPPWIWARQNSFYGFVRARFGAYWIDDGERKIENTLSVIAVTTCGKVMRYDDD